MVARINHNFPDLHITEKTLLKMLKQAILQSNFEERGKNLALIYLTLDSWLQLQPRNPESKLIAYSRSKLKSLISSKRR